MRINVAVVGTGEWGQNHVRLYKEMREQGVNLYKICDLNKEKLKRLSARYHVDFTTDVNDIINDSRINAVNVCTTPSTHYEISKKILEAEKDVLIEKPMCLKASHGRELIKISEENKRVLMVGHILRFNPVIQKLKELIDRREFGELYFMHAIRISRMPPRQDCGVIHDFATHDFDLFSYLLDRDPDEISNFSQSFHGRFCDIAYISIKYGKIVCNTFVSWLSPIKVRDIYVVGSEHSAKVDYHFTTQTLDIYSNNGSFTRYPLAFREPLQLELEHFIECVKERKTPLTNGVTGLKSVILAEAAVKAKNRKVITLGKPLT